MERITIESSEGRPWSVVVTTADGVEHRFVRSDDTRASALKAAHDGYDRGYANGLRDGANPPATASTPENVDSLIIEHPTNKETP